MSKYNVGDRVLVRDDLRVGKRYGSDHIDFVSEMKKYLGTVMTIISNIGFLDDSYECAEDYNRYTWSEEMFAGLADETDEVIVPSIVVPVASEINARLKSGADFLDMFTYEE